LYLLHKVWTYVKLIDEVVDFEKGDPSYSILLKDDCDNKFLMKALDCNNYSVFEIDLLFTKGRIRITELGIKIEEFAVKQNEVYPAYYSLEKKETKITQLNKSLLYTVNHIYKFLCEGIHLSCSFEDSFKGMELMNRIKRDIENGKISKRFPEQEIYGTSRN
jgi:hypothetical protein